MVLERTYTINLRRAILRVPKYKRAKKAINYIKEFISKHMKAKEVKIGQYLNYEIWKNGIKNPPTRVTVDVKKDDQDVAYVEISGKKYEETTAKLFEQVEEKKDVKEEKGSKEEKADKEKKENVKEDEKKKEDDKSKSTKGKSSSKTTKSEKKSDRKKKSEDKK